MDADPSPSYYDALMKRRDEQRSEKKGAKLVIKGNDLPVEANRHGLMQWYLHPAIPGLAVRSELVYMQTIPPSSRSGKQHHPGGVFFYFWRGSGRTVIDEVEYRWVAGELIQLPHKVEGCVYQHFNDGDEPAKILVVELNMVEALGVDRGSGWEQLEDSPDFPGSDS